MKKQMKKLALAKETVQRLESVNLEVAAEGVLGMAWSFENSCQFICLSNRTLCSRCVPEVRSGFCPPRRAFELSL